MLLHYELQGDAYAPETGVESCIDLPGAQSISLAQLQELFPYYGTYHFRLRIADAAGVTPHVWLDVTRSSDDIVALARNLGGLSREGPSGEALHVRALPLSFDAPAGADVLPDGEEAYDWGSASPSSSSTTAAVKAAAAVAPTAQQQQNFAVFATPQQQQPQQGIFESEAAFQWEDPPPDEPQFAPASQSTQQQQQQQHRKQSSSSDRDEQQQQQQPRARRPSGGSDSGHGRFGLSNSGSGHFRRGSNNSTGERFDDSSSGADWKSTVDSTLTSAHAGLKSAINSKAAQDLKKSAKLGFGKLMKLAAGAGGSSSSGSSAKLPSSAALDSLDSLANLLETPFNEGIKSHAALLTALWEQLFDGQYGPLPTPPRSVHWKSAGMLSFSAYCMTVFPTCSIFGLLRVCIKHECTFQTCCNLQPSEASSVRICMCHKSMCHKHVSKYYTVTL
jgi:hypothetical protein